MVNFRNIKGWKEDDPSILDYWLSQKPHPKFASLDFVQNVYSYNLYGHRSVHSIDVTSKPNLGLAFVVTDDYARLHLRTPYLAKWLPDNNHILIYGLVPLKPEPGKEHQPKAFNGYLAVEAHYLMNADRFEYAYQHNFIGQEDTVIVSGKCSLLKVRVSLYSPISEMVKKLDDTL